MEDVGTGTGIGRKIGPDLGYHNKPPQPEDEPYGRRPVLLAHTKILLAAKKRIEMMAQNLISLAAAWVIGASAVARFDSASCRHDF